MVGRRSNARSGGVNVARHEGWRRDEVGAWLEGDEVTRTLFPASRKVALLPGRDEWWTEGVPEWGLEAALLSDGPHGSGKVEGDRMRDARPRRPGNSRGQGGPAARGPSLG